MREQWQIDQGKACPCGGADDMCPCQNVNRSKKDEVRRLGEREIRQAIAHYLSRQGSAEYDPEHVFLRAGDGSSRGWHATEFEATAIARPQPDRR